MLGACQSVTSLDLGFSRSYVRPPCAWRVDAAEPTKPMEGRAQAASQAEGEGEGAEGLQAQDEGERRKLRVRAGSGTASGEEKETVIGGCDVFPKTEDSHVRCL